MKKLFICLIFISFTSCFSTFDIIRDDYNKRGKKIAVISGSYEETTYVYSKVLEKEITSQTTFKIINQQKIKNVIGKYPINITGPFEPSYTELRINYDYTNHKALLAIGRRIGVDYIYAVWVPSGTTYDDKVTEYDVLAQMYDVKSGKEIGRSSHKMTFVRGVYIGWGAARSTQEAMKKTAVVVASEIGQKMGKSKNRK